MKAPFAIVILLGFLLGAPLTFAAPKVSVPLSKNMSLPVLPANLENIHARFDERWQGFLKWAEAKRDPETMEILAIKHKDWLIRNAALVVTQTRSFEKGKLLAVKMLADKALIVRMAAVEVLKESVNDREVRDNLWDALYATTNYHKGQSLPIRPMILGLLSEVPNSTETERFRSLAEERDPKIKIMANLAVQKISGVQ